MMRRIPGFKYAVVGLFGAALVVACNDDEDAPPKGGAGNAGSTSGGGGSGGKAPTAGTSSSGTTNGGTDGGTDAGAGTAGSTSGAGTGGTAGTAGTSTMGGAGADAGGAGGAAGAAGEGGEGGAMGGAGGAGGAGGEGGAPFVADVLDNPGFEATTLTGWINEGTTGAAYVEWAASPHGGAYKLSHWTAWVSGAPDYTARTYQTVAPIANGTYSFSVWVDRDYFKTQYLFARGFNSADATQEMTQTTAAAETPAGYVKITLTGIPVTSGTVTVGVYSSSETGSYTNFDDAELVLE